MHSSCNHSLGFEGRRCHLAALIAVIGLLGAEPALAYVGPGAGFAVTTTLLTVFIAFFSALGALLLWPFRYIIRFLRRRRASARARVKRFVVLGLDGLEPRLVEKMMDEGKLPTFAKLREQGTYRRLRTTAPAMTPVAWASFLTGCNPGKHNVFDFLTRDKKTYFPMLSSAHIGPPRKTLHIGRYRIPFGKPDIRLHRKGVPFWNLLGEHGVFSNIIRMPITFPPEKFRGVLLSAMCVPDLRGSQGTFSFYTSAEDSDEHLGGEQIRVQISDQRVQSHLVGPENTLVDGGGIMHCPFEVKLNGADTALMNVSGETLQLKRNEYSKWVQVKFPAAPGIKVKGICQFLLLETKPHFKLYVTPIQIDPGAPALQISHPKVYATYFAKLLGPYATMGLAEDTWGLNAKILDDEAFLQQCEDVDTERIKMFFDALDKTREGLVTCVIDGPDRVNHMYWRYLDPQHPAHAGQGGREVRDAIERVYQRMDTVLADALKQCDDSRSVLMVLSDHGCASFRRGIDLNRWLEQEGYLKLKDGERDKKYLQGVDWSQTRAYCIGLTGLWLNIKGREAQGIVEPEDAPALRAEIAEKLNGLKDPQTGDVAINRAFEAVKIYRGPYKTEAPDLIVGYNEGYRVSWEAAVGQPTEHVFHDNLKAWSGDHIIDPRLMPGVLFCNRKLETDNPHITDLAPTIMKMFGVEPPANMDGTPIPVAEADGLFPSSAKASETAATPPSQPTEKVTS